ncbi:Glucose-inhibited division family A protein isoform 1 [Hibiscus syriacus]|uniref:Glucose-inhibited division family A protein isoform 1 n=1 Tax=Hibiscus syriacus TaxID=106335 RepID=A0A6A2ZRM9_HIBSY|nr:Glucose-inhibited division family A protein isoform 1 [Hibiscus syriacus]
MPESDIGRTYIWTISCILFICVAIGAGCLLVYMTSPRSPSSDFLPILGFILVCMPWLFWIITIVYRITSRAFGFRMVAGNLYGNSIATTKSTGNGSAGGGGDDGDDAATGDNDIDGAEIPDAGVEPSSTEFS